MVAGFQKGDCLIIDIMSKTNVNAKTVSDFFKIIQYIENQTRKSLCAHCKKLSVAS